MKTCKLLLTTLLFSLSLLTVQSQVTDAPTEKPKADEKPYERAVRENNFGMEHLVFFAPSVDDQPVGSDILSGNIVVYVYGNTACASCIGLGRAITEAKLGKYNKNKDVKFIYFTSDNKSEIKKLASIPDIKYDHMISLPFDKLVDIGFIMEYKPTYVVVDRSGKVVAKGIGCSHILEQARKTFDEKIGAEIDKLLAIKSVDQ